MQRVFDGFQDLTEHKRGGRVHSPGPEALDLLEGSQSADSDNTEYLESFLNFVSFNDFMGFLAL